MMEHEYGILYVCDGCISDAIETLVARVEEVRSDGWRPQGGVSVVYNHDVKGYRAVQAMVREKKAVPPIIQRVSPEGYTL